MKTNYSSRKFLLVLLVIAVGVGLQLESKLTPLIVDLLKWSLSIYCTANVGQKAKDMLAAWLEKRAQAEKVST